MLPAARLTAVSAIVAAITLQQPRTPAADESPPPRPYQDGPLTPDDYQAAPAEDSVLHAFTVTEVKFQCRHQYVVRSRTTTASLTEITIDAVVMPAQSWIKRRSDTGLLDHEQGHFDLTMIAALRARLHFAEKHRTPRLTATGVTRDVAAEGLRRKVESELRPFVDALLAEHQKYDALTKHGLLAEAQAEQRREQRDTLKELSDKLNKLAK